MADNLPDWTSNAISALFGGGGVASWLVLRRKTLDRIVDDKIKLLLDEYRRINDDCQRDRDEMRREIAEMKRVICLRTGCGDRERGF